MLMRQDMQAVPLGSKAAILAGGLAHVVGALAFLVVFSYLAANFNYPDILDGSAERVLPALLETGPVGRAVWALYGVLPLVFIPAAVGAYEALRPYAAGPMRVGALFALLASIAMVLGLFRWPSVHWELAQAWTTAGENERTVLAAMFDGLNRYLGNYIGEFLGELSLSLFFLLSGAGVLRHPMGPRWIGWWGILTGVAGLIGMWRNVTEAVSPVAEVNNYLLPAWMIGFGVWLIVAGRRVGVAQSRDASR
jgi:hypothetical protein